MCTLLWMLASLALKGEFLETSISLIIYPAMQTKQDHDSFTHAWNHGESLQPGNYQIGNQETWILPIPEELQLNAEEIEDARPWHGVALEEQMAQLALDPRQ